MTLTALLYAYVLGGLTFLPLCLALVLALVWYGSDPVERDAAVRRHVVVPNEAADAGAAAKAGELKDARVTVSGWVTVRRTYDALPTTNETYVGMMSAGYRSFMDQRSKDPRRTRPRDTYYAVLKRSLLFLYEADPAIETPQKPVECVAAIQLGQYRVGIFPEGLTDAELFMRRNAICLAPLAGDVSLSTPADEKLTDNLDAALPAPWFVFPKTCLDKEDWLHHLVHASKLADPAYLSIHARDRSIFDPADMSRLVDGIDRQPDAIPTRWLNAMLGRLFLAVYRTAALENYIVGRIVRKLNRVNKPGFLSEVVVREVNVGTGCPFFSKPMLKELTPEGDAAMEAHVLYQGNFRITIETTATINLGSRFKPYQVRLVLAVVLKELEGTVMVRIKRPPSARLWHGFTATPRMVLAVEPIVSTRQIKWSMILKPIEARLREVIAESVVYPHLDDLAFFDTRKYEHRGGIYGDALRQQTALEPAAAHQEDESEDEVLLDGGSMAELGTKADADGDGGGLRKRAAKADLETASVASAPAATSSGDAASSISASSSSFSLASWANGERSTRGDKRKSWFTTSGKTTGGPPSAPPSPGRQTPDAAKSPERRKVPPASTASASDTDQSDSDTAASRLRSVLETDARKPREPVKPDDLLKPDAALKRSSSAPAVPADADSPSLSSPEPEAEQATTPDSLSASRQSSAILTDSTRSRSLSEASESSIATVSEAASSEDPVIAPKDKLLPDADDAGPATARPTLPDRPPPSLGKLAVQPPPKRRDPSPESGASPSGSTTTASIIQTWRKRAEETPAVAAGVASARDTMNRWRANLTAMRKTGLEAEGGDSPATSSAGASPSMSRKTSSPELSPTLASSPRARSFSSARTGSFYPPPAETTTSLSLGSHDGDRRMSVTATSAGYSAGPTMAIPGIHDPAHRGGFGPDSRPVVASLSPAKPVVPPRPATRDPSPARASEHAAGPPLPARPAGKPPDDDDMFKLEQ